jgi:hypothetical protein
MVEQVMGRGELDAPSASPIRCCSRQVAAVLEVDAAGQRRDVAAATVASAGTMVLPGVAAEIGGEGLKKRVARGRGLANELSIAGGRAQGSQERTREDARSVRTNAKLIQI